MVVKFLQTYALKTCAKPINIKLEIENFRESNQVEIPIIVFDLTPCIWMFALTKTEISHGGRQQIFCKRVDKFLSELANFNTKLVFFLEGPVKPEDYLHWVEDRNRKYDEQKSVHELINAGQIPKCKNNKIYRKLLSSLYDNAEIIAKKYGEIYNCSENECDLKLAKYATDNNALAVITDNSDFFIMPGNWDIWLKYEINIHNMTAITIKKSSLRKSLNLRKYQMPILATLCGNGFVPYEFLANFRRSLGLRSSIDLKVISNYVQINFNSQNSNPTSVINKIVDLIEPSLDDRFKKVEDSLNSYSYDSYSELEITPTWLKNHCNNTSFSFVYRVIKDLPFNICHTMLDLSVKNTRPFQELVLPILQREMGIVLYENRNELNIKRDIYLKPNHETDYQMVHVSPKYPEFDIPHISQILDAAENGDGIHVLKETKLDILRWIISPKSDILSRSSIEHILGEKYFIPLLVLNYLVKERQITIKEADAVFFTIYKVIHLDSSESEFIKQPKTISSRSCFVTFTYTYMVYYFYIALIVSGLPEYIQQGYFDGYIFNDIYFNLSETELECIKDKVKDFRLYAN